MLSKAYIFFPGWENIINKLDLDKKQVVKVTFDLFSNGEKKVWIPPGSLDSKKEVVIIGSLRDHQGKDKNIYYLLLLVDALNRAGIKDITLFSPFLPYSRQDRIVNPIEPISIGLLFRLLNFIGVNKLVTFNLHNKSQEGLFNKSLIHIDLLPQLVKSVINEVEVIVAPDTGRAKEVSKLAHKFNKQQAILLKQRDLSGKVEIETLVGNVVGKNVLIVDDMIDTGGTMIKAMEILKSKGAKTIFIAAVHGLFSPPAKDRFKNAWENKLYRKIIVADTTVNIPDIPELEVKNIVLENLKSLI